MKAIIDGKRYNTETAEQIAEWSNHHYGNDFRHCEETLYRTKKGFYFIAGSGGPMSRYAEPCGDCLTNGSAIRPLTHDEALEWLEDHGLVDAIEEHFSDSIDDA